MRLLDQSLAIVRLFQNLCIKKEFFYQSVYTESTVKRVLEAFEEKH